MKSIDSTIWATLDELPQLSDTRGEDLMVTGGGLLEGVEIRDLRFADLEFRPGLFRSFTLKNCVLSRWQVRRSYFRGVRLVDCTLADVDLPSIMRFPKMRGCTVEGRLQGPLERSDRPVGNDFSGARGISFHGGVSRADNVLPRLGPDTILISRDHPGWARVLDRAERGDLVARTFRYQLSERQEWEILYRETMDEADWQFYAGLFGEQTPDVHAIQQRGNRLPSFGPGELAVLAAVDDGAALAAREESPRFGGELTPALLTDLASSMGLEPRDHWESVVDSDDRWIVRLSHGLCEALARISDSELEEIAFRAWGSETDPLSQVDLPSAFLQCLRDAARVGPRVYLTLLP